MKKIKLLIILLFILNKNLIAFEIQKQHDFTIHVDKTKFQYTKDLVYDIPLYIDSLEYGKYYQFRFTNTTSSVFTDLSTIKNSASFINKFVAINQTDPNLFLPYYIQITESSNEFLYNNNDYDSFIDESFVRNAIYTAPINLKLIINKDEIIHLNNYSTGIEINVIDLDSGDIVSTEEIEIFLKTYPYIIQLDNNLDEMKNKLILNTSIINNTEYCVSLKEAKIKVIPFVFKNKKYMKEYCNENIGINNYELIIDTEDVETNQINIVIEKNSKKSAN